jgi:predicted metal-dependent hydrolase
MNFDIIRTNRKKSVSIEVNDGIVKVRVPKNLSEKKIQIIINDRLPWIEKKIDEQAQQMIDMPKRYVNGELFSYLGNEYQLQVIADSYEHIVLNEKYLQVMLPMISHTDDISKHVHSLLTKWYEQQALSILTKKTEKFGDMINKRPASIKIRDYKSRWGSCSSKDVITYNWRIIIGPEHVVDYVVVHELSHLLEHNHSKSFWKCVEQIFPDFKNSRKWLKMNGQKLRI